MAGRPRLRKREIVLAVGAGVLAAGGGAAMLDAMHDDNRSSAPALVTGNALTYTVGPFTEVSTVGPQDVIITQGDKQEVRAEGSPAALSVLEAVVENGKLMIRPREGFGGHWRGLSGTTFHVTVPRLEAISLAGPGDVRIDKVAGKEFEGTIAGSGELTIGDLRVDDASLSIGGSGSVVASGKTGRTRVAIGGSGQVHGEGLQSETASVSIGGSGDAALAVRREARVSIMGSGNVEISGPARCSVSKVGSGNVSCANTEGR
jgi:hypothetical protein